MNSDRYIPVTRKVFYVAQCCCWLLHVKITACIHILISRRIHDQFVENKKCCAQQEVLRDTLHVQAGNISMILIYNLKLAGDIIKLSEKLYLVVS
ncbi:hypothetical protein OA41_17255 [Klebsiella aerogenes]|nr:hypothetical protein OA41_17255 [Klebsiella aerogenes]